MFLLTGVAAVIGGGLLVVRPDGAWLGMSRALLDPTPFGSFRIPGLVLAAWIAIQAVMLGVIIWLQPLVFLVAILEAGMTASALPRKDVRGGGRVRASRA